MLNKSSGSKRKTLTATLLSMLVVSALAAVSFVNPAAANPMVLPLEVTLLYPENKTYTQLTIKATFTHHAPEVASHFPPISEMKTYYRYILDGKKSEVYLAYVHGAEYNTKFIDVSPGTHTLQINAFANGGEPGNWELISYAGLSQTVTFTVDTAPTEANPIGTSTLPAESSPTIWIALAVVASDAVVCFGLLAYFVKFKRKRNEALAGDYLQTEQTGVSYARHKAEPN